GRVETEHLGVCEGDFVALERLVVEEGKGVQAEVDVAGDLRDRGGLGVPVNLWAEEVFVEPELAQLGHRSVVVVAAGDRMEDAPLVEGAEDLDGLGAKTDSRVLQQDAVP